MTAIVTTCASAVVTKMLSTRRKTSKTEIVFKLSYKSLVFAQIFEHNPQLFLRMINVEVKSAIDEGSASNETRSKTL